jgi:hypothetical protein
MTRTFFEIFGSLAEHFLAREATGSRLPLEKDDDYSWVGVF